MMEKSSAVILTDDDLEQFKNGVVSERVQEAWQFTLEQLSKVVENKEYQTLNKNVK